MSDTMIPSIEVVAPRVTAYPFGLFSVAPANTPADAHWQNGVWWRSAACNGVGMTFGPCTVDDPVPALNENVVCGIAFARPFTIYARSDESMGGSPLDEKFDAARDLLLAGEQYAVEQAVWQLLLDAVPTATAEGASIEEGVAMAEALIADDYGGSPVLHMSRYTAGIAYNVLHKDGQQLKTVLDTAVVAGGGYLPSPVETGEDVTVFATGGLVVVRGELNDLGQHHDRAVNNIDAVVERTYVIGWDCSAVRVDVPGAP